jgi:uroporphyrinogen decarboxylase
MKTLLQRVIQDKETNLYPVWLMRQAGRYMPEYMAMKQQSDGFLDMALTPWKAAEITMQPINAFDMDAAIIFSDILVINYALGQELDYTPSPVLGPYKESFFDTPLDQFSERCEPVYEAIRKVRKELNDSKSLIGFAAAPWTLCKYMCHGKHKLDVVQKLIPYIINHLLQQIEAGCDTIQIFDSHAGDISNEDFQEFIIDPTKSIVDAIRANYPEVCIIAFPRLVGPLINDYIEQVNPDAINISDDLPIDEINGEVIQGGISVKRLIKGEDITPVLEKMKDKPYIVNLAHGIDKTTPVENVKNFVNAVKDFRNSLAEVDNNL